MPSDTDPRSEDQQQYYANAVIGAAIFDLSGLPKEYFTTAENGDISWVQTIFQALGLRSLLISSLQIDGFHHAVIHGTGYCAIVVKQRVRYVAILVRQEDFMHTSQSFIQWMQHFEPVVLNTNPRFSVV
ncbi:MAG: hypothetical protein WBA57_02435 [Elainellaceae cyanobacterium]